MGRARPPRPRRGVAIVTLLVAVYTLGALVVQTADIVSRLGVAWELRAMQQAGIVTTPADLRNRGDPAFDEENARIAAAAALLDVDLSAWADLPTPTTPSPETLAAWRPMLARYRPALDRLDQPADPPVGDPIHEVDVTARWRLGTLLTAAGVDAATRGDAATQLATADHLLLIADATDAQPVLRAHVTALALRSRAALIINAKPLTLDGPGVRAAARDLVNRLLDDSTSEAGFVRAIDAERVNHLVAFDYIFARGSEALSLMQSLGELPLPIASASPAEQFATLDAKEIRRRPLLDRLPNDLGLWILRPMLRWDVLFVANYSTEAAGAVVNSATWAEYERTAPPNPQRAIWSKVGPQWWQNVTFGRGMIATVILPRVDALAEREYRNRADRRLAAIVLTIRLFQADHDGQLPPTLDALVPDYLPSIPADPTDVDGANIGYDAERAIVWTSGEDGDDDAGISRDDLLQAEPDARPADLRGHFDEVVAVE